MRGPKATNLENDWQEFFTEDEGVDMDLEFEHTAQELSAAFEVDGEDDKDGERVAERLKTDAREKAFGKHLSYGG